MKVNGSGLFLVGIIVLYIVYGYFFDETRRGHPDYRGDTRCLAAAGMIYGENLEEALENSSVWELSGYKSAQDYAQSTSNAARSRCR